MTVRAKMIDAVPYAPGSEAVRVTAAPVRIVEGRVTFDEANPIEAVYVPLPWNIAGEVLRFARDQIGSVGKMCFADGAPIGGIPEEVPADQRFLEFFLVGR
ncbi:hypothetical protein [Sphingosinicella sp. BN140058]|uniref:hypothetical protein n=1 Tax=Sphingosinicella sp. BN140058 TaxID=1892855 RepID=UPI0010110001|nr:hypothetical protein [Sphingosinicella sp. BN140058]QAY80259.1 hypothetical protein ETR14_26815 [Sphingosinicella sp. BN140058]